MFFKSFKNPCLFWVCPQGAALSWVLLTYNLEDSKLPYVKDKSFTTNIYFINFVLDMRMKISGTCHIYKVTYRISIFSDEEM